MNEDKWKNKAHISLKEEFDSNIKDRFGPEVSPYDNPDINLDDTPLYKIYEDDTTEMEVGLVGNNKDDEDPAMDTELDREVPTLEANDNYVNSSVMLPRGNSYARGKVIRRKKDADRNCWEVK